VLWRGAHGGDPVIAASNVCPRTRCTALLACALLVAACCPDSAYATFGLDDVAAQARQLAQQPVQAAKNQVPEWMLKMTYDQWRDIRFRPDHALWRDQHLPFQVQFFHPGLYYGRTVAMNVVDARGVHALPFNPANFDYGKNDFADAIPHDIGYAGLRIHAPIKTPKYYDEVIVFLGASYFRSLGKHEIFGASARGLAIDTVEPSGEEFPSFTEFWLVQPGPHARSLTLYALLDSSSVTGAYRFEIQPGEQTSVNVDVRLFRRKDVHKLGIAPLTSMFFFGENARRPVDNFRPEIHDSDGLMIENGTGEWLWRPLDNPDTLQLDSFQLHDPKGFGLLQRDRNFDHYQDLETRQELRPSIWIVPRGAWGDGRVELAEIPTKKDINDNIVTYWVPATLPALGEPLAFSYAMYWYGDDPMRPPAGRVVATRREPGSKEGTYRFVIDFGGKTLEQLPADAALRGVVTVAGGDNAGEVLDQHVIKNPVTGGWRLSFQVSRKTDKPLELRAFLEKGGRALTETWTYGVVS
jgi:periplasmic glucans biosynthesis protein